MARYEMTDGSSAKFWEVQVKASEVIVTYGRIGSNGQTKVKPHGSAGLAKEAAAKLTASKIKKGYAKVAAKKAVVKKTPVKKAAAVKKTPVKKAAAVKKTPVKKTPVKKTPAKKAKVESPVETLPSNAKRYEMAAKFWQVHLDGSDVVTTYGKIGSNGQSKAKSHSSARQAKEAAAKLEEQKSKKGYKLVLQTGSDGKALSPPASNPKLEAVIRKNPDDADGYLVYGDWLQGEGEAIGELVSLQHALVAKPKDKKLRAAEVKLLKRHQDYFFGGEQPVGGAAKLKRGKLNWRSLKPWNVTETWDFGYTQTNWRNGFVHDLVFHTGYSSWKEDLTDEDAGELLATLLALPASRFVQRIGIGEVWSRPDYEGPDATDSVRAIAASACAATLREFIVMGGDHDTNGVAIDASLLWSCPNLEVVELYGGEVNVGKIKAANVRRFAIRTGGLDYHDLKAIGAAKWPKLEDLEIWFGDPEYGCNCTITHLNPLLKRKDLKLKRLGIMNMEFGDQVCAALVKSPLLKGLKELDLTMGVITDAGAKVLLDNQKSFAKIDDLKIAGLFSDDIAKKLKGIAKKVTVTVRGPDEEDYRYVQVGE